MTFLTVGHTLPWILRAKVWALEQSLELFCCSGPSDCHPKPSCQADTWELILQGQSVRCPQSQGSRGHLPQDWDLKLLQFLHYCSRQHLSGSVKKCKKIRVLHTYGKELCMETLYQAVYLYTGDLSPVSPASAGNSHLISAEARSGFVALGREQTQRSDIKD